jgi:hypothetical protein
MSITNARYSNPDNTLIKVTGTLDGMVDPTVPATVTNSHYRQFVRQGLAIAPWRGPSLAEVKASAKSDVDRRAEDARAEFLTPGDGQMLEYVQTQREALAAVAVLDASGTVDPADYPMLEAERAARADASVTQTDGSAYTLADVAREIVDVDIAGWTPVGAEIKRIRRTAKLRIEQATDGAEVQAVLDGLSWPEPAT